MRVAAEDLIYLHYMIESGLGTSLIALDTNTNTNSVTDSLNVFQTVRLLV